MTATLAHGTVHGYASIVIKNRRLRAVVIPLLGGRVWEFEDRVRGRQWIWHQLDVQLRAHAARSNYDEVWAGGWEELFPNVGAGRFEGRDLPDHGEWWTLLLDVQWHEQNPPSGCDSRHARPRSKPPASRNSNSPSTPACRSSAARSAAKRPGRSISCSNSTCQWRSPPTAG